MRKKSAPALLLFFALFVAGCGALSKAADGQRPPDFALLFFVHDLDGRSALHLLEPNRTLRVAIGKDVTADLFPPITATLSPGQMDELWTIIDEEKLIDESSTSSNSRVTYHLSITQRGQTHRLETTPLASPGATRLLNALIPPGSSTIKN